MQTQNKCEYCKGTGLLNGEVCYYCDGKGYQWKKLFSKVLNFIKDKKK